jgi:3-isopropylmalate/(R)-2-methylmalate dehydratase small subunit
MNKSTLLKGKAIVIKDNDGESIKNIDTDMIFHNKHLHITNIDEMGQYSFGNLPGWENFPNLTSGNDFLIVGANFGAGSSRQQAVDCFRALGVKVIIGESFGAIYKRNAINSGLPLITAPTIMDSEIKTGDDLSVDLVKGEITNNVTGKVVSTVKPLSKVQLDIYQAGNLFEYGKSQG